MNKQIRIQRTKHTERSTIGKLFINDEFICHTLELPWLGNSPRKSCIPAGRYPIIFRNDPGSKYTYPHLHVLNVPNREWILVHKGNYPKDTLGCILPGMTVAKDFVGNSGVAFLKVMESLKGATSMSITITNA